MEEKKTFFQWVKEHKKELIFLGIATAGTVLIVKKWDYIEGVFKDTDQIATSAIKNEPVIQNVVKPIISNDILENLTGKKLTATKIGSKVLCSAQEINKRIVASGLAIKLPNGEYSLTEAGQLLGEYKWKTTRSGYSFSNIEWDEKILEVIFSAEELSEIENKQKVVNEILTRPAA